MNNQRQGGFSLIEIMVVIVIMGLLLSVIGPTVWDAVSDAKTQTVKGHMAAFKTALQSYRLDNYNYPTTEQGLQALVTKPSSEPVPRKWRSEGYMEKISKDPWGNDYVYTRDGDGHPFNIVSLGGDGVPGGEDDFKDISYWDEPGDESK